MSRRATVTLLLLSAFLIPLRLPAQQTLPVLLLSDIHFDPFLDPGKVPPLAAAPVSAWRALLDAPASPDRESRLASLDRACPARARDTDQALFRSSLAALHAQAGNLHFVAITGDLMAHGFDCKFKAVFPAATANDYRRFAVKTVEYVLTQIRATLPGVPVYAALGNNDSGCGDYRLDPHDAFLADLASVFLADLTPAEQRQARADFSAFGDYAVTLAAPFRNTRLILLDDLYESTHYAGCSGTPNSAPSSEQLAWLTRQLDEARAHGQKIWLLGHIPPGIDPFSTALHLRNVCAGQQPDIFLSSSALANTLAPYGEQLALVLFAHTHMDEIRLIRPAAGAHVPIAIKMIPSISPINGNRPAFTLARVDPATATLADYSVFSASDNSGTTWARAYNFRQTYHLPGFNAATAAQLTSALRADSAASTAASKAYLLHYSRREFAPLLAAVWPQYTCALSNFDPGSYHACRCSTEAVPASPASRTIPAQQHP